MEWEEWGAEEQGAGARRPVAALPENQGAPLPNNTQTPLILSVKTESPSACAQPSPEGPFLSFVLDLPLRIYVFGLEREREEGGRRG